MSSPIGNIETDLVNPTDTLDYVQGGGQIQQEPEGAPNIAGKSLDIKEVKTFVENLSPIEEDALLNHLTVIDLKSTGDSLQNEGNKLAAAAIYAVWAEGIKEEFERQKAYDYALAVMKVVPIIIGPADRNVSRAGIDTSDDLRKLIIAKHQHIEEERRSRLVSRKTSE